MSIVDHIAESVEAELALKRQFAEALLRHNDDKNMAAAIVFGDDSQGFTRATCDWYHSQTIANLKLKLLEELGAKAFLPTKDELALRLWDETRTLPVADDRIKAAKLLADVLGYIDKPGTTVNNNVVDMRRVMVVRDFGTDAQWEQAAILQQRRLMNGN